MHCRDIRCVGEPEPGRARLKDMDPVIEYFFGAGDGELSTWHTRADLDVDADGLPDAVALDFDGDGRADDAMWDSDGDGRADRALLDLDDDGRPEAAFADGGRGLWELPADGPRELEITGRLDVENRLEVDTDGDGQPDQVLEDVDGDGYADRSRDL